MLSIDIENQRKKLKGCGWACTVIITAHDSSGREQEMSCVDADSFPQWMVTIHASKVAPEARPMLLRLQRVAKQVLADRFFGRVELAPFHGDELWAVERDGKAFVAVKRVCGMLAITERCQAVALGQLQR
jgi:hypothetical protein